MDSKCETGASCRCRDPFFIPHCVIRPKAHGHAHAHTASAFRLSCSRPLVLSDLAGPLSGFGCSDTPKQSSRGRISRWSQTFSQRDWLLDPSNPGLVQGRGSLTL